jgi:hypothetical protein
VQPCFYVFSLYNDFNFIGILTMAKKNFIPNYLKLYYKNEIREYNPSNFKDVFIDFINFIEYIDRLYPEDNIMKLIRKIRDTIFPNHKTNPFIAFPNEDYFEKNKDNITFTISKDYELGVYTVHSDDKLIYRFHLIVEQLSVKLSGFNCIIEQGTKKDHLRKPIIKKNDKQTTVVLEKNENKQAKLKKELYIDNLTSDKKNSNIQNNLIFLSNPNSGKTYTVKKLIGDNPSWELSFQNNDNVLEWKKNLLFKNINGEIIIGNIIKAITSATLNPNGDYFIFADEVGTFSLDNILGNVLKNIFKNNQKIKVPIEIIREYKDNEVITLDEFIELGNAIKEKFKYNTTTFNEEELNVPLWIPSNLHFVFCANYENELLESLSNLKGWGISGNRFKIKHFYNLSGKDFYKLKNNDQKILIKTKKYNELIIKKYEELLISEKLSSDTKKTLFSHYNKYKILLSNYDTGLAYSTQQQEYVIEHIQNYIYSLFLDEEDENIIIEEFKDIL